MSLNDQVKKRDELQARKARQEGRISDRLNEYQTIMDEVEKEFGTRDLNKLRQVYSSLQKEKKELDAQVAHGNALTERAIEALEKDMAIPGDVLRGLEELIGQSQEQTEQDGSEGESLESDAQNEIPHFEAEFEQDDGAHGELLDEVNNNNESLSSESEDNETPEHPLAATVNQVKEATSETTKPRGKSPASSTERTSTDFQSSGVGTDL